MIRGKHRQLAERRDSLVLEIRSSDGTVARQSADLSAALHRAESAERSAKIAREVSEGWRIRAELLSIPEVEALRSRLVRKPRTESHETKEQ